MKCPYCHKEMERGSISQDLRHQVTWVSDAKIPGRLLPIHKTIRLTHLRSGGSIAVHHCEDCKKFVIDENDIEV